MSSMKEGRMPKRGTLKVSKISLESLQKLQSLGYFVIIEQVTLKPNNPRIKYAFQDAINVLTAQAKYSQYATTSGRVCKKKHVLGK